MLGWERWREIAADHGLGLVEAAMLVARAEDTEAARAEVGATLNGLLEALGRIEAR